MSPKKEEKLAPNPNAGSSIVRYQTLEEEDIGAAVEDAGRAITGRWDPPQGESVLRVLPARPGEKVIVVAHMHFAKIAGLEKSVICNCPRLMEDKPCPLCEEFMRLSGSRSKADRDLAYSVYRVQPRGTLNILVRGQERKGVQRWSVTKARMDELLALRRGKGGGDYSNPTEKGFDLILNRTGTGLDTEYKLMTDRTCSPLVVNEDGVYDEEKALWLIQNQPDNRVYLETPTYGEIEAMMRGETVERRSGGSTGGSERRAYTPQGRTVGDAVDDRRDGGPSEKDIPF